MVKSILTAAACLAAVTLGSTETMADDDDDGPPTLSVSGTGRISSAPDVAEITMGVLTKGSTAREALAANSEAMTKLIDTLKQRGVAAKDIQTSQIQVVPQYSQARAGSGCPATREIHSPRGGL